MLLFVMQLFAYLTLEFGHLTWSLRTYLLYQFVVVKTRNKKNPFVYSFASLTAVTFLSDLKYLVLP